MTYEVSLVFQLKVKLFYISGFFCFFFPKPTLTLKKCLESCTTLFSTRGLKFWRLHFSCSLVWSLKVPGTFANLFFTTSAGFHLFYSCNFQSRHCTQYCLFQPRPFVLFTFWSAYDSTQLQHLHVLFHMFSWTHHSFNCCFVIHVIIFNLFAICQDVEFQYEGIEEFTCLPEYVQVSCSSGLVLLWPANRKTTN